MDSQYVAELCVLLIEDNFGELFGRIFSTLHRHERLTLPRLMAVTRISESRLRAALVAMIQHHLVYHYTSIDEGATYYSANMQSAYNLVRSGRILEFVENRLGKYATTVMSAIMYLGHAQVSYLETLPELQPQAPTTNGVHEEQEDLGGQGNEEETNGVNGDHVPEDAVARAEQPALLHPTLKALAAHGYVIRVREAQFQSYADNVLDIERTIKSQDSVQSLKGKKLDEVVAEKTIEMLKERLDGDLTRGLVVNGVPRGVKRRHVNGSSEDGGNKRQRFDYDAVDGEEEEEENEWFDDDIPMDSSLTVRVNYEKLDVALRNRRFLELAERDAPPETSQVYNCLLRRIEYQTPKCRDSAQIPREGEEGEQYSVAIALSAVAQDLDPYLDLSGSIGPMDSSNPRLGKRSFADTDLDDDDINGTSHSANKSNNSSGSRAYEIDQHLSYLSQSPFNLTSKRTVGGLPTWSIEFRHLARKLRHLELERMIESRYGDVALRVIRVLHAKGKLDEKRLQEISLLPFKDLRQVLASMQKGGFVDLQEVPRDAQRQPSRTIYLWYYDPDRIRDAILQDTYKAMSRCLQRLRFERGRLKEFLEKTERSDVKGNEERYLSEGELERLREWRAKEALLLGEVARLDDMVAVMRDY